MYTIVVSIAGEVCEEAKVSLADGSGNTRGLPSAEIRKRRKKGVRRRLADQGAWSLRRPNPYDRM